VRKNTSTPSTPYGRALARLARRDHSEQEIRRALRRDGFADEEIEETVVRLLDRVLAGGVVISGDITLSIADVDLVVISLRTLVSSVGSLVDEIGMGGRL